MSPFRIIREAVRAIWSNAPLSIVTVLGIAIGAGAMTAVLAVEAGADAAAREQVAQIGKNLILARPAGDAPAALTLEDAWMLTSGAAPAVARAAPETSVFVQARTQGRRAGVTVIGATAALEPVRNFNVAEGRFLNAEDVATEAQVVVLGTQVSFELFGGVSPVEQTVFLNERPFLVVGLLDEVGDGLGVQDDVVVAPITTVYARLTDSPNDRSVALISIQAVSSDRLDEAEEQVRSTLRRNRGLTGTDDFTLTSEQDIIGAETEISGLVTIFLASIAGIALFAGGVGVLNVMHAAVRERRREIGLRRVVGAKPRDILYQFLAEALLLGVAGGALGIGFGTAAAELLEILRVGGEDIQALVSTRTISAPLLTAVAVGLLSGVYPAARAARLDPIDALRRD